MILFDFFKNFYNDKTENSMKKQFSSMKNRARICNLILASLQCLLLGKQKKIFFLYLKHLFYLLRYTNNASLNFKGVLIIDFGKKFSIIVMRANKTYLIKNKRINKTCMMYVVKRLYKVLLMKLKYVIHTRMTFYTCINSNM